MVFFSQFSMFAWADCSSFNHLRPNRSTFDYHCAEGLLHYAQSQADVSAFFDTPLVPALPEELPAWLVQAVTAAGHTTTVAASLIKEHVSTVLSHFVTACAGQKIMFNDYDAISFNAAVVAADLLTDGTGVPRTNSVWATAYGATASGNVALLKDAFGAARQAVDGAKVHPGQQPALLYAEGGLLTQAAITTEAGGERNESAGVAAAAGLGSKVTATLDLLRTAKQQGAPIDGVLIKLRCGGVTTAAAGAAGSADDCANQQLLSSTISAFGGAGFPVWISLQTDTATADPQDLPAIYAAAGKACASAASGHCRALHLESGFSDAFCEGGVGVVGSDDGAEVGARAGCMLDDHYKAKQAFVALQQSLQ
jgi:hypothetical protein